MDIITTKTIGAGIAKTNEFILTESSQTAIVFKAQMHEGGIRGWIVRYKKDKNGQREDPIPVDFRKLHSGEGIEIELNTEAVTELTRHFEELNTLHREKGVRPGTHRYRITDADSVVITDHNKARFIRKLLDADLGEEIWNQLVQENPSIATRLANSKIQEDRALVLHHFEEMLQNDALQEKDWQQFFEEKTWIFGYGLRYQILRLIQSQPQYGGATVDGRGGERGDFLTATEAETRFTCLVEIKKPTTPLLQQGQYRRGARGISSELAGAISQIQVNCAQWEITGKTEQNRERLGAVLTIAPKGIVVIGRTSELDSWEKKNSFERFRQGLNCPEIITYDELYERAKFIVGKPLAEEQDDDFDFPF